jgi:acetyl-CoA carboxylase, biotin carboxylase subunit
METSRYKKVLIANRGEIAIRILRSVREAGFKAVAVYSEADRNACHVRMADEAYFLGPSPASESYLAIHKLVETAKAADVWGVHPGYGFLSENAAFAKACEDSGLTFIGPPSQAIAAMGDKLTAREFATQAGLSMAPASGPLANAAQAKKEAKQIGYPVLLKAKSGGGGKGMRRVDSEEKLDQAYALAESEALKAFRDGTLYMEKYVVRPRHIEVQVFADSKGNVVSLGDRECSIQRRHQKIIEEAPAPRLSQKTKETMAEAAKKIAAAVGYVSAGTVEFLVDDSEHFYFLEMNTRLQVEHPVTEWITGLDLVRWQLDVAEGKPLPVSQSDIVLRGHAIETRIYAEDPSRNFFPSPGTVDPLSWPLGPGIRIDSGIEAGSEVSLFYDPMLAKISAWNETRESAVTRLESALREVKIGGVQSNLSFLQKILRHPRFRAAQLTTTFIQEEGPFEGTNPTAEEVAAALATIAVLQHRPVAKGANGAASAWWLSGLPRPLGRARP